MVTIEGQTPKTIDLDQEEVTVGRSQKNDLPIESEAVSRNHLLIRDLGGTFFVRDLGSANGTFINDTQLEPHNEVEWSPLFPLQLGWGVTLTIQTVLELEKPQATVTLSSARMKAYSPKRPKPSVKSAKEPIKPYLSMAIMLVALIALFFFYDVKDNEPSKASGKKIQETLTSAKSNPEIYALILENRKRICMGERGKRLCSTIGMPQYLDEGAVIIGSEIYIYLNGMLRSASNFKAAYPSDWDTARRLTFDMLKLAFTSDFISIVKHQKIKTLFFLSELDNKEPFIMSMNADIFQKFNHAELQHMVTPGPDYPGMIQSFILPQLQFFKP